jgi:hypothetical protein
VAAQEMQFDPEYASRAAALKADDAAGHFELAKWALKKGLNREASAEADKLLALDSGDLRGKYLKQEAGYYQNGAAVAVAAPVTAAVTAPVVAANSPDNAVSGTATSAAAASGSGEATTVAAAVKPTGPMTKDEVDKLYKTYEKNIAEFRSAIQPLLVNRCGSDNCHGSSERAGRFYLSTKGLGERATIAENFRSMDRYIDHGTFANSRLLTMAVAKSDVHKTDKAPIIANENDAAYKALKAFLLKLPTAGDLMWGTGN